MILCTVFRWFIREIIANYFYHISNISLTSSMRPTGKASFIVYVRSER